MTQVFVVRRYQYDPIKEKGFSKDVETFTRRSEAERLCESLKEDNAEYYVWPMFKNLPNPDELR